MRQVNVTSVGDDARETLTIAGLEKAKERSLEQHVRLRAPQTRVVLCASVDQYLRTTVDSSAAQLTPMEIGAVVSTCVCCRKSGYEKSKCRLRNAKCSTVAKVAAKAVKVVTTPTSAIAVDKSAMEDLIVLNGMKVAVAVENVDI